MADDDDNDDDDDDDDDDNLLNPKPIDHIDLIREAQTILGLNDEF
jgi:hypothetical protein